MDERIERRPPWVPWMVASVVFTIVAIVAYGLGAEHQAQAGVAASEARDWHWGFGGIWGFFLVFWMFGAMRWMRWGGCYRPWRYRHYSRRYYDDDDHEEWQEWHRREHQRMDGSRTESRPIT